MKKPPSPARLDGFDFQKDHKQMISTDQARTGQWAIALAREMFPNLASTGILGGRVVAGPPIDVGHVEIALAFLSQCRKSKVPAVHSYDLRAAIGNVSVGATIVACIAAGFDVHPWFGVTDYAPHALIGVNAADVARLGRNFAG